MRIVLKFELTLFLGCLYCCLSMKCKMYHHYNSNLCLFRACSICSSCCCMYTVVGCGMCLAQMGDDSWMRVNHWQEVHNTRTGQVVSSTEMDQAGYQACGQLCALAAYFLAQVIWVSTAGFCWVLSSPGFLCGNGEVPDEPWQDHCISLRELYFRLDAPRKQCGCHSWFEACCYASYVPDNPKSRTELRMIKQLKKTEEGQ